MHLIAELPLPYLAASACIFGLLIGSFLNVVIHRVPRGEPIVWPGSHCPACQTPLRAFDNIPLLSYVWLRGRCRHCTARIPLRYPAVELLTALLFAAIVWRTGAEWLTLPQMAFAAVMLVCIFIDAKHQLLPDVITYPAYLAALAAGALNKGWRASLIAPMEFSGSFNFTTPDLVIWQAALFGALVLALAAPAFLLLDWLDAVLFDRYFEEEAIDAEAEPTEANGNSVSAATAIPSEEIELDMRREKQRRLTILGTMLLGLILALLWAGLVFLHGPTHLYAYERAYQGLCDALLGALVAAGSIWLLRAGYFVVRQVEGMGLGDVKMMAVIGAFLGWYGAFTVLLYGSVLGTVAGLFVARLSPQGFKTAFPFGTCLGAVAIIVLLFQ